MARMGLRSQPSRYSLVWKLSEYVPNSKKGLGWSLLDVVQEYVSLYFNVSQNANRKGWEASQWLSNYSTCIVFNTHHHIQRLSKRFMPMKNEAGLAGLFAYCKFLMPKTTNRSVGIQGGLGNWCHTFMQTSTHVADWLVIYLRLPLCPGWSLWPAWKLEVWEIFGSSWGPSGEDAYL